MPWFFIGTSLYALRHCLRSFISSFTIQHNFRQANTVVDRLATWAHMHKSRHEVFWDMNLHTTVRTALRTNRLGLWNYQRWSSFVWILILFYAFTIVLRLKNIISDEYRDCAYNAVSIKEPSHPSSLDRHLSSRWLIGSTKCHIAASSNGNFSKTEIRNCIKG